MTHTNTAREAAENESAEKWGPGIAGFKWSLGFRSGWQGCEERYRPLVEALLDAWVDYPAGHDEIFNPPAAVKAMHKAVADLVDLADCTDRIFRPLTGEGDGGVHGVVHGNSAFEELLAAAEAYLEPSGSSIRAPKLTRLRAAIDRAREGAGNDD